MQKTSGLMAVISLFLLQACSPSHFIGRAARQDLLRQPELSPAQVGICVYDPAAARYLYNYQSDKYFVPASNTKLFSLYAGLKYLGDSLVGMRYRETDTALFLVPSGDPTLLHPAFLKQPVIDLLKKSHKTIYLVNAGWQDNALGRGWAWDDYNDDYMAERSPLPVYGNVIKWVQEKQKQDQQDQHFDPSPSFYSIPDVNWKVVFSTDTTHKSFFVMRRKEENIFEIFEGEEKYKEQDVPFVTNGLAAAAVLLKDTVGREIFVTGMLPDGDRGNSRGQLSSLGQPDWRTAALSVIHSQPTDSLFRPMLYHSDNFFAEQTLLMAANTQSGSMKESAIIDTLLNGDLRQLPQRPYWVDGSGLSRYNLFTPQDFVYLLDKMKNEFGLPRMKGILPTGGAGTLSGYYKQDSGYLFAKTGTLSGVVSLSGYLVTRRNRLLLFSILVNNHRGTAASVRRDIERLIQVIRNKY
jgi:D-alanyl-D-alanine carboxypeptidase/D-alanyl-D-alanine-endopeptidase (penicillin-binding protein 4)